ncbi:uncharacterized protein LOC132190955 [Corylus avellana]|uniref:uncharacterized protein LOC132190955 n=1 Tax=Corylus avellana TaxID=13451 RepID=UPI00286CDCDC|nr:uncharacterized protein LOC132190955 [Corylus avellana]
MHLGDGFLSYICSWFVLELLECLLCKPYLFLSFNKLCLAVFMILVESVTSTGISALVIVVYEHVIATIVLSLLAFFLDNIDLSKHWAKHDPLHSIYNGPHLPPRKSQILEHHRTGEDMGSTPLGCRSIGCSVVEGASSSNLYVGSCTSVLPSRTILNCDDELIWHNPNCLSLCICDIIVILETKVGRRACLGHHITWGGHDIEHAERALYLYPTWVLGELQGVKVTGLSYYVMTWAIKKKGVVFEVAFNPVLVVFSFLLQTFLLGNSAHLGSIIGGVFVILGLYLILWAKANDMEEERTVADDSAYSLLSSTMKVEGKSSTMLPTQKRVQQ